VVILDFFSSKFVLVILISFGIFLSLGNKCILKNWGESYHYSLGEKMKFPYFDNNFQHVAKT
jgi:hypothetical protein